MSVSPERLGGWLEGFGTRHGAVAYEVTAGVVMVTAQDGSVASVEVPFPPLPSCQHLVSSEVTEVLTTHALTPRTVGVLLVRLGGYAVGVFEGPTLVASKVGSRHVQGRTAAGGWSQQRFARRRAGQAVVAYAAAADVAANHLLGRHLDAIVVGGDRSAVNAVLADSRLAPLRPLVTGRLLAVPDPRLKVLEAARFRDVWIKIQEP